MVEVLVVYNISNNGYNNNNNYYYYCYGVRILA